MLLLTEEEWRFPFESKVFAEGTAPVTLWPTPLCVKDFPLGLEEIRSLPTCFKAAELRHNVLLILKLIRHRPKPCPLLLLLYFFAIQIHSFKTKSHYNIRNCSQVYFKHLLLRLKPSPGYVTGIQTRNWTNLQFLGLFTLGLFASFTES